MSLEADLRESEHALTRIWKPMALRGACAVAFAIVILVWPKIGVTALVALFGAFALVSGVATLAGAYSAPMPGNRRAWLAVEGLLGIAVGIVAFAQPGLSALGLLYAVAAWANAIGIFQIALAVNLPSGGHGPLLLGL